MTPYESYLIGRTALRNSEEYAEQADLLAERGWHGRSLALAILGQEEHGNPKPALLRSTAQRGAASMVGSLAARQSDPEC